jgi:protein SCO1/2
MNTNVETFFSTLNKQLLIAGFFSICFSVSVLGYEAKPPQYAAGETPPEMKAIAIEEKLGTDLNLELKFNDENGQEVALSQYYDGKTPVIISLVYYSCPGLCNYHLNGLIAGLKDLQWNPGKEYKVLAISFDEKENAELALGKKENYLKEFGRGQDIKGFHFLTGSKGSIEALTASVGFKFQWNEKANEWSHSSAAILTTPQGKVSRYLHGVIFQPQDLKLAINEAAHGKMGGVLDRVLFYCMKYDPTASKYTIYAFRIVQIGGVLIIGFLALLLIPNLLRRQT